MKYIFYFLLLLLLTTCTGKSSDDGNNNLSPSHQIWNELLKKHVSADGKVDYKGFIRDKKKLTYYLDQLSNNPPDEASWNKAAQLAYWINAYNAFTVKLIVDHYPVKSITDLHPRIYIPLVNTVWHMKFFTIGGQPFSLDQIEHEILRKKFNEPRIHFAIVCASYSCPPLRNEAFTAEKIDKQLNDQARVFINDNRRNKISQNSIEVSQIFTWFEKDFTKEYALIEFLNKYASTHIDNNANITYMPYNWDLNE